MLMAPPPLYSLKGKGHGKAHREVESCTIIADKKAKRKGNDKPMVTRSSKRNKPSMKENAMSVSKQFRKIIEAATRS